MSGQTFTGMAADAAIEAVLATAAARLDRSTSCATLEAQVLLGHAIGKDRAYLLAWPRRLLSRGELAAFRALVRRRRRGEPIAYITGRREFWSLDLEVSAHTLIPRPETELVVELALAHLPLDRDLRVADLGTGSGAIALALARERPRARVIATDASPRALAVARRNAARLELTNVEFRGGDWFAPLAGERLDMVCCNPPYIRRDDPCLTAGDLRHEPPSALVAGAGGLEAIEAVAGGAVARLRPGGRLVMEHGHDQGEAAARCLAAHGFEEVATHRDLAGDERAVTGCVPLGGAMTGKATGAHGDGHG